MHDMGKEGNYTDKSIKHTDHYGLALEEKGIPVRLSVYRFKIRRPEFMKTNYTSNRNWLISLN